MKFASRMDRVPPYLFVEISRKIAEKKAQGIDVISFGIGDPDIPTPASVVDRLRDTALDTPNHRYPETDGLPEFRQAVADWYQRRFGIAVRPDEETLPLIGAKGGHRTRRAVLYRAGRYCACAGPGLSGVLGGDVVRGR